MRMSTPSRREFFTYAAAAALASALPTSAQTNPDQTKKDTTLLPPKDTTVLPLVVDVIGPMAFRWSGTKFELWMPVIDKYPHQAGIMTTVDEIELKKGDYEISGPSGSPGTPKMYPSQGAEVFQTKVQDISARNRYIKMLLPMPRFIVVLHPEAATISKKSDSKTVRSGRYAVGVRLLYDHAGKPSLEFQDEPRTIKSRPIEFYAAPSETQTNMLIGYSLYNSNNTEEGAKYSFEQISQLFGLDLEVAFDSPLSPLPMVAPRGPMRNCMSPDIGLVGP